jgi:transposase-like protein
LPLKKWFVAIYLTVESKKGISANQIKRTIGVSYKTAWYLCHRIRAAMTEPNPTPLSGTVEVDETFVGGRQRNVGRIGRGPESNKTIVAGIVQRGGDVRMSTIKRTDRKTLHAFIKSHADPVSHRRKEYVRGDIHTNTIENVWSLLKRSVAGSYHKVSEKHLDAYLDELEWRFNNRKNQYLFRDTLTKLLASSNLEYKALVAA